MAANKRSFLLYADIINTVKKLPIEKAGQLFVTILEYVNDNDPVVDDLLIELAFEPIKQSLKRDLQKWETMIERKSQGGKKSAELRKLKELETKDLSIEDSSTNFNNVEDSSTLLKLKQDTLRPSTVNDSVSVSVNVSDSVILNQKEVAPIFEMPRPNAFGQYKDLGECVTVMKNENGWHSIIAMSLGIPTVEHVVKWVDKFDLYAQSTGWTHTNISEVKKYFRNWLDLQLKKGVTLDTATPGTPAKAEGTTETPTEKRNRLAKAAQQQQQQNAGN